MTELPGLPQSAFDKADRSPDASFYGQPRFVLHIDDGAVARVTRLYAELLPEGGDVLDLMSSWVSHLPPGVRYASVVGHGMNSAELAANPALSRWFVQDLNQRPVLDLASRSFDACCLCVSVQYLQRPVAVFAEVFRILRPGGVFVVSFSNRCFPTKAVAIWQALDGPGQQRLVGATMDAAGLVGVTGRAFTPSAGDPLWSVVGYRRERPQ